MSDVIYSIFNPDSLAQAIQSTFDFRVQRCLLIKATVRAVYHIWADAGEFVLYVYRADRTRPHIEGELALIQALCEVNFPTACPILPLMELEAPEGKRIAALFQFIAGTPLSKSPPPQATYACGRLLADLHQIASHLTIERPRINWLTLLENSFAAFEHAVPQHTAHRDYLRSIIDHIQPTLAELPTNQLMHGDIIPSNILMQEQQPYLIDFDFAAYGCWLYDVASFLVEADYWDMGHVIEDSFIRGYQSHDQQIIRLLKVVRCIEALGIPAANINTWGLTYFSDSIINRQIELIKRYNPQ